MSKAIRIRTTPGGDDNYVSVNLNQDFDQLNILSLSIGQEDAYRSFDSNYGVVAGRIDINNGFGLKNAKVSIFIPLEDIDASSEVVSALYPYRTTGDKNSLGKRYNLLPNRKQSRYHTPVGTFPSKREILDNTTMVEVYNKYYKFTTTTNESGDYMFFGVPVGDQQIFIDIDVSDIGFLSVRPYDLISKGKSKEDFIDQFEFSDKPDLDKLPQIISKTEVVNVLPFWSDDLEETKKRVGVTRYDFSVTEYELTPTAMFLGSVFSDNDNDSLSKNCRPRKKMGRMNDLITGEGKIEAITRTTNGSIVKSKEIPSDSIDENGNWAIQLPMNLRKMVTDEFGALIPSPDGKKGISTEADYRFRISMGSDNGIESKRTRAKLLVPNMTNNYEFGEFTGEELKTNQEKGTPIFNINKQLSYFNSEDESETDPTIQYNYLEDFFTFRWKKVYTVRQYIPRYQPNPNEGSSQKNFIGFKQIMDGNGVNKIPYNRLFTKGSILYTILCYVLTVIGFFTAFINGLIQLLNGIISNICETPIPFFCLNSGFENAGGRSLKPAWGLLQGQTFDEDENKIWGWGAFKDGKFIIGKKIGYDSAYCDHVLGASKENVDESGHEAWQVSRYWQVSKWTKGWNGIWSLFKKAKDDDDNDVKNNTNQKRAKQQNWLHDPNKGLIGAEVEDDDIDRNDCGRPSDWVYENLGGELGWTNCWTFRGDIPSKRRIRNCIGFKLNEYQTGGDVDQGIYITQTPYFSRTNNPLGINTIIGDRRWWRLSTNNDNPVKTYGVDSQPDGTDNYLPIRKWSYKNVWYSAPLCMDLDRNSAGGNKAYYRGCKRTNVGDFNFNFVNKEWWKDDLKVRKCNKPECKDGIRILGICISFNPKLTRICPVKGLCNKCTNDDEVDYSVDEGVWPPFCNQNDLDSYNKSSCDEYNNNKIDSEGNLNKGDNYGVNRKCCAGCNECDEYGLLQYYKDKYNENPNDAPADVSKVYRCGSNCLDGCCETIAPISLRCREDGSEYSPALFSTGKCGADDVVRRCKTCSGVDWSGISDWVECSLETIATSLGMLDFEFYNDWMNGSLYYPLIKRKLKIRKRKKGKNDVKKDVFCDYDCDGTNNTKPVDYQTPDTKQIYSVKIVGGKKVEDYNFEGCIVTIPKRMDSKLNFDSKYDAYRSIEFNGYFYADKDKPCSFTLNDYCSKEDADGKLVNVCKDKSKLKNTNKKIRIKIKEVSNEHGKPKYLKTSVDGEDDIEVWENFGGHGHHKNKCKENYLIERLEYIKKDLSDCQSVNTDKKVQKVTDDDEGVFAIKQKDEDGFDVIKKEFSEVVSFSSNAAKEVKHNLGTTNIEVRFITKIGSIDITNSGDVSYRVETKNKIEVTFVGSTTTNIDVRVTSTDKSCSLNCAEQGTAACSEKNNCGCDSEKNYNTSKPIYRGLIKEKDNEIYYSSIIDKSDVAFNSDDYKKNILFPTNITELGSSVNCDIDEAPFIIGELPQTSYQLSEEDLSVRKGKGTKESPYQLKEKESIVNLSAYIDFGCSGIRCMNVRSSLTAAQVGSDLYDLNDAGLECKTCSSYSDVDTDVRGYFCRRFSTFVPNTNENKNISNMSVNYIRQGSTQGENYYEPYNEVSPKCNSDLDNKFGVLIDDDGNKSPQFTIDNDLNDGDFIIPGDKCGYRELNTSFGDVKYFYAMDASSHTKNNLKDFPYNGSKLGKDGDVESNILVKDDEGISITTTQTPYFFYFGLVPGKTALNKLVGKYFADIIDATTLEDISGGDNGDGDGDPKPDDDDDKQKVINLIESNCLKY